LCKKFYSSVRGVKSEALSLPCFFRSANSAVAVKSASLEEFRAVSHESCNTPMMKPTPTTCIAISLSIPKLEQATGIKRSEPPATPDAPHAPTVEMIHKSKAVGMSTEIPNVCAAAKDKTAIVIDAPAIFIVAPNGIEIEYKSSFKPKRLQRLMFMGMLAALERVKKA